MGAVISVHRRTVTVLTGKTNLVIVVSALFNMQYYDKMRIVNSDIKSYYFSSELTKNFTEFANESAYVLVSAFSNANYTLLLL